MVNTTPIQVPVHPPSPVGDNSDALIVVRDVDLVEDIAQETFIRADRALHQFQGESQFHTRLYGIAINTAKRRVLKATGQAPTSLCVSLFPEKGR